MNRTRFVFAGPFQRGRRMRTPLPYNVLMSERERIGGDDWDVFIVCGWFRSLVSVYHHWTGRFEYNVGFPPLVAYDGDRGALRSSVMSFLEKSLPKKGDSQPAAVAKCPWLSKQHPAVHEYLVTHTLPDGTSRQCSTLTLFVEGGLFKLCLSEKDHAVNLFASGDSLEAALDNLEERLTAPVVDWRQKGGQGGRKSPTRS